MAVNPRTTTNTFIRAIEQATSTGGLESGFPGLEDIKIVVKWKHYESNDATNTVSLGLVKLRSDRVRRVCLEDKNGPRIRFYSLQVLRFWPNTQELHLDCGLGGDMQDYTDCKDLGKLRTISIPFPYAGALRDSTRRRSCCMRSLFRSYVSEGFHGLLQDTHPLREIIFHYLTSDGLATNYTKVKIQKYGIEKAEDAEGDQALEFGDNHVITGNTYGLLAEDLEDGEIPEEDPFTLFTMEDLGDKPTDPVDQCSMRELMLIPALRGDERRWITPNVTFLKPFLNELAAELMAEGNQLEHWKVPGDAKVNTGINRSGFKCTGCNCII